MKTAGIGDMILLSAVAQDALDAFPKAEFVIISGPENAQLAELIPRSRALRLPTAQPWKVIPLLRAQRLDALVDLGQWTRLEALYASLSGARWTAGFNTRGQNRHYAYDATVRHRDDVHALENYRALIGRYRLTELIGVLAAARCVISVNTGVMHMAAAVGAPTIALNGPTSSLRWGPIGPNVVNVDSDLPACGYLNLGFEYNGQRHDCMQGISVERVLAATRERADA